MSAPTSDRRPAHPLVGQGIAWIASAFVLIVCVSIVAIDGWRTYHAREVQLQEGVIATNNLVQAIAQHAFDTLKEADSALIGVISHVDGSSSRTMVNPVIDPLVRRLTASNAQIYRLSVISSEGRRIYTSLRRSDSGLDASRLDYFIHHRDDQSLDAYVGPLIKSDISGQWILTLSRRFNLADGTFGGIVAIDLDLDYFREFYRSLDIGAHGTLVLAAADGTLIERRPWKPELVGSSLAKSDLYLRYVSRLSEGNVRQTSTLDGVDRQIAYRNLDGFPLYVVAALSTAETLAAWKSDALIHAAFVGLLVAVLAVGGTWIVRQIRRRNEIEDELHRSRGSLQLLNDQLVVMANEDGLTGLSNRRELDRVLLEEMKRAERTEADLALILLDVDFFKAFNDRYGHLAGDDCLRKIASALARCVHRPCDLTARYGGEEFAVVLPGTNLAGAIVIAQKICNAVRALNIPHEASEKLVVTVSAGVALLTSGDSTQTIEMFIRSADMALYSAKKHGRDGVEVAMALIAA